MAPVRPAPCALYVLTCPGREAALAATLESLAASDWPKSPRVVVDSGARDDASVAEGNATARGHLGVLRQALTESAGRALGECAALPQGAAQAEGARRFLVLEDDVIVNRHLARNLAAWPPLRHGWLDFGTLYNPGLRRYRPSGEDPALPPMQHPDGPTWFDADPATMLAAQARLFSPKSAAHILEKWPPGGAGQRQDRLIARLAAQLGPLWVHTPSLVQHRAEQSTWGGPGHAAWDFDEKWVQLGL